MGQAKKNKLLLIVTAIVLVGLIGIGARFLPLQPWFLQLQNRIDGFGAAGPVVFALVYIGLTVLLIPGSVLTLGAGTLFGLRDGVITVVIAANLGALCSFLLARTFLRKRVARWAEANPKFAALDRAIGSRGFRMALLSRLSPVFPFTLLNYLLGLTRIGLGSYILANLIGMLPGTFLYVYLGAAARDAVRGGGQVRVLEQALKYVGLLATLAIVVIITRAARRAMAQADPGTIGQSGDVNASEVN